MNAYLLYSPLHYCCLTLIRSLPGLGNISICANFRGLGKYWILSIALNIIVISLIAFGGRFFQILPLIRSIPGALLFFVLSIMFLISCADVLGMVYSLSVLIIVVCAASSV